MRRDAAVRVLSKCFDNEYAVIFSGEDLCREAFKFDGDNFFYMPYGNACAFGCGVAASTSKRVFVVCDDDYLARHFSDVLQMAAGKYMNLYCIVLVGSSRSDSCATLSWASMVPGFRNAVFDYGFLVHNYTHHLKLKNPAKSLKEVIGHAQGPLMAFLDVGKGAATQVVADEIDLAGVKKRFSRFLLTGRGGVYGV